jgi:hypothetical protein
MAERNTAAFGMYPDRIAAEEAVDAFRRAGFRTTDVSFLHPENSGTKDLAHEKHTKAPEGAMLGVILGGIIGATSGWIAALGMLALPAADPLVIAGPIVSALAGLGVGAVVGALIGALVGTAQPEYEAIRYRGRVRNRGVLLSVHCDNKVWVKRALKLLAETGSTNVATSSEAKADFAASDKPHHRRVPVGIN